MLKPSKEFYVNASINLGLFARLCPIVMAVFWTSPSSTEVRHPTVLSLKPVTYTKKLEAGLLERDGNRMRFVLFGDNAYLNSFNIATPYSGVSNNPDKFAEDNYNFYHSQLHIHVECAFGMLV